MLRKNVICGCASVTAMIKRITSYHPELYSIERLSHVSPWSEGVLQSCFTENYQIYGWFSAAGILQGFCVIQQVCDEFTLMNIAVAPAYQGQGIGGQLLRYVQALAAQHRAKLWLEVRASNAAALHLYEKQGFSEVGRRPSYYPRGDEREDAVIMSWQAV